MTDSTQYQRVYVN